MSAQKSFSNLSMSEKRKRLMAMVEMRKNMKRKQYEKRISMLEKGEKINSKKPINGSTKMKKLYSHTYKKKFQNRGPKGKKVSQGGDHIASSDASNEIEEYWVPVHLSHVQKEQYCSLLNSNLEALSSSLRDNSSLNDILTQTQKCCDHPYLVDPTLHESLKTDLVVDQLDAEISVSGKLQVLDKLLFEIKQCGLRVVVLFQSMATSKEISIGDILDDLVDKRFGQDSYIRIHGKILSNNDRENRKKDIKMFNSVGTQKFVCLLDSRACYPNITLSSMDVVILFNSDWNPSNDIKALRKLTLDSKRLIVLRLYSSFTIEEKALIVSKQGSIYDSNTAHINYNNCHRLLAWGASYLFSKLSKDPSPESKSNSNKKSKSDTCFIDDLVQELSSLLMNKKGNTDCLKSSIISNAYMKDGSYSKDMLLFGEMESHAKESESCWIDFWTNLFKDSPWKNSCSRLSRRVQKSFRNNCDYWFEGYETENQTNTENFHPSMKKTKLRSKRKRRTSSVAKCTNNQPSQAQTLPVVPPVSDQSSITTPLETELENMKKEREQVTKLHDEKKSMLVSECEKELLEVRKKYDALIDESEMCLTKRMKALEEYYELVYANKVLAETLSLTCDDTFTEDKTVKEISSLRILEIPASALVQSKNRCTSSIPTLRAPAPHLRSSSSLFASLPTLSTPQQTQTELSNVINQENTEKIPVLQSPQLWSELLAEFDSFYGMGYPNLPYLDSN